MCPSTPNARSRNGCRPRARDRSPENIVALAIEAGDAHLDAHVRSCPARLKPDTTIAVRLKPDTTIRGHYD
jgi:hypothetical protein